MSNTLQIEHTVKERYGRAAKASEAALCCAIPYNAELLTVIPPEVIEKDYGCGDPSKFLGPDETVLDLGSGAGKICFIAAQVVGRGGKVIGVDMTEEMLEVARRNAPVVAARLGYANVEFRKGRIQDLALDLERLDRELKQRTLSGIEGFLAAEALAEQLRRKEPMVASESIDAVVSNCVLNLVEPGAKQHLFAEIFRVLKEGGRAVISDIVSDREVPQRLQDDPELRSGCLSGAFTHQGFLEAFAQAGFRRIQVLKRDDKPWRMVEHIEFRSVTVRAFKPKHSPLFEPSAVTQPIDNRENGCCSK